MGRVGTDRHFLDFHRRSAAAGDLEEDIQKILQILPDEVAVDMGIDLRHSLDGTVENTASVLLRDGSAVVGQRYLKNFELVRHKMKDLEERDRVRNFQPPITGEIIMQTYAIPPCQLIGQIKERIKNAILDGEIPNEYEAAYALMEQLAEAHGLKKQ